MLVSQDARVMLSTLWSPDTEVTRLIPSPEDQGREIAFGRGRGEGADQIVRHDGKQVLRIAPSVRRKFDGSTVEVVDGALAVEPAGPLPADDGS